MEFYKLEKEAVLKQLNSNESGLTEKEASSRLEKYGLNELKEKKENKVLKILLSQLNSFVVYILIVAVVISLITKQYLDASVIGAIIILNIILGFIQEYRAEKSIEALKKLETSNVKVLRNNKVRLISSKELVLGDIVLIDSGMKIPADCYLLEAKDVEVNESILTGESTLVKKYITILKQKTEIAEQVNMLFSSTTLVNGRAKAVVVGTGMSTEVGKIATLIQEEKGKVTPLQNKLKTLGLTLGIVVIAIALVVLFSGVLEGQNIVTMLLIAISLAVAAVPEGLPAVVTISLAIGVQKMIKKNVLIRKLASVETLGSTTVICSDKTGTITQNKMKVTKLYLDGQVITPEQYSKNKELMLKILVNCNDAHLPNIGDPTEIALLEMPGAKDIPRYPRIDEVPFTSERKYMITFHKLDNKKITFAKFAPEKIYELCSYINYKGRISKFTSVQKQKIMELSDKFAKDALRVLGYAYHTEGKSKDMIFLGLVGMIDPPREEVKDAIKKCKDAGIKVVMITGDHKLTAQAIARQIGLRDRTITGKELEEMTDEKLIQLALHIDIYARVNPEHKVRILDALKKSGQIVAMTGDGVNDAPALKKADIGIAVNSGTDVAKEASDMILLDDHFNSIVLAVEEGRAIYDNIKKFVNYLLSSNFGEVLIIFLAMLLVFKVDNILVLPLTALQILWINLVTDGLPALALGIDPMNPDVMKKPPRNPKEKIISKNMMLNILVIGLLISVSGLILFKLNLPNVLKAQTIVFTLVVVLEMVRVQMVRSQYKIGLFSNKWLIFAILTSLILQILVVYFGANIFKTVPLNLQDWVLIIIASLVVLLIGIIANSIIRSVTKQHD